MLVGAETAGHPRVWRNLADAVVGYPLWWAVLAGPLLVAVQMLQEVHRRVPPQPWELPAGLWLAKAARCSPAVSTGWLLPIVVRSK